MNITPVSLPSAGSDVTPTVPSVPTTQSVLTNTSATPVPTTPTPDIVPSVSQSTGTTIISDTASVCLISYVSVCSNFTLFNVGFNPVPYKHGGFYGYPGSTSCSAPSVFGGCGDQCHIDRSRHYYSDTCHYRRSISYLFCDSSLCRCCGSHLVPVYLR